MSRQSSLAFSIGCFQTGWLFVHRPGAAHPITNAMFKALTGFCLFGLWPKRQATDYAGNRLLNQGHAHGPNALPFSDHSQTFGGCRFYIDCIQGDIHCFCN